MTKVKKQHYLPQFYLRRFADASGKICVVDSKLAAPYIVSNVRDIAQGRYYYDFLGDGDNQSVERMFSLIESKLAPAFDSLIGRIQKGESLTSDDKSAVTQFLKFQFLRSDWMRDKIPPSFIDEYFKPEYVDEADRLLHAYIISEGMFTEMLNYVSNYDMRVLYANPKLEIFTSSLPLFFDYQGIIDELILKLIELKTGKNPSIDSNLFFPITPRYAIYIFDPNHPGTFTEDSWFSSFVSSGIAWSGQRIYFRRHENSLKLYPVLKPLLNLRSS